MVTYSSLIVQTIADAIQIQMQGLCTAHDFFHIQRVVSMAQQLHRLEGRGDLMIIEIGALMHESLDTKFFAAGDMQQRQLDMIDRLLSLGLEISVVDQIMFIIENVGYGKSLERDDSFVSSIEFEIVEDADRLEAVGAISIARTFAYGGSKGRELYNPDIKPLLLTDTNSYANSTSPTINHFYEKLLLLKDTMHTTSAHHIAIQRHEFMEQFLTQFYRERDGVIDQ